MIGLSQTTGYAIKALACIEGLNCRPRLIRDVATCAAIPRAYLAQIVRRLSRQGIVVAKRGYRGGIRLARPPEEITLLEIVEAIEGGKWISPCLVGWGEKCPDFVCPTRAFWQDIRRRIESQLRSTTLAEVIASARRSSSARAINRSRKARGSKEEP